MDAEQLNACSDSRLLVSENMNDVFYLLSQLLKKSGIKVDGQEVRFQLLSHPSYPSLHAIAGVLDHFSIENLALSVPVQEETLSHLPESFMAEIEMNGERELVVVSGASSGYHLTHQNGQNRKLSSSDFLKEFTGIILAVEHGENDDSSASTWARWQSYLMPVLSVGLAALVLVWQGLEWQEAAYMILSVMGLVMSIVILREEMGESTVIGDAFCSGDTPQKGCHAVLYSKGATLFEGLKLSDLSLAYFGGLILSSFLLVLSGGSLMVPYDLSLAALPITFYSLYYQYFRVNRFCNLCLTIVAILWLQAGLALSMGAPQLVAGIAKSDLAGMVLAFIVIAGIWRFVRPLLTRFNQLRENHINALKFKRNSKLFRFLLSRSSSVNTKMADTPEILLGNKNAPVSISVVTNPACGHCQGVHKMVSQMLEQYPNEVSIGIRFNVNAGNPEDVASRVAARLMELYFESGTSICLEAMDDAYGDMDGSDWLEKWGESRQAGPYQKWLLEQQAWCAAHKINFTPQLLVNGKAYPREYERKDLLYFIEDLALPYTPIVPNTEKV